MADDTQTIQVDGQEYDAETVSGAMLEAILGRAPVAVMGEQSLKDGIGVRIRWALGAVSLIASQDDTDDTIIDAAEAAVVHLEQARQMFSELTERSEKATAST